MLSMKPVRIALVTSGLIAAIAIAATPADLITARQQSYKQIGKAMKGIGDELKGGAPAIDTIRSNARTLDMLAPKVATWFPKGTGPEAGVKTAALPAIWTNNAEFKQDATAFVKAAHDLNVAAAGTDMDAIKAAAGAVGKTCRDCHQTFRQRDS